MVCPACLKEKVMVEEHHEIPQAAGGSDGSTIQICTECHEAVHLCARKFLSGKGAEAQKIADSVFSNKSLANRLIKSAVQHTLLKRDGKIHEDDLEYKLNLVFPGKIRRYLEVLSKNSRMGINKYITKLITDHIKSSFPKTKL